MSRAFFFDMDGVLFDSMPHHALAWEAMSQAHGFAFSARDTYLQEGRTGQDVIQECYFQKYGTLPDEATLWALYQEKTERFEAMGETKPVAHIEAVLQFLQAQKAQIWVVTGSGQKSLLGRLEHYFPTVFSPERMITAYDVTHGKPHPEPYLKAWERSKLPKSECCVVENAPLGIQSGKSAGLFTIGVNTGILQKQDLEKAGADVVFNDMQELLEFLILQRQSERAK